MRQRGQMPTVQLLTTTEASDDTLAAIHHLLLDAFGAHFGDTDWEHALGGHHVVVADGGTVVAHASVVARTLEVDGRPFRSGYVEAVATTPAAHGRGFGSLAMAEVATLLHRTYELGALSTGRHGFYERLGWERWQGPTFVRRGLRSDRTEDDDDGVLVLRFGPSAAVDRVAALTCEARTGDDW